MYIVPLLYRISSSTKYISIIRLHQALQAVIIKHSTLRTTLYLDLNGIIMQHCIDAHVITDQMKPYRFSIVNLHHYNNDTIDRTIQEILNASDLFDLSKGHVISCHIIRQYCSDDDLSLINDDRLTRDDLILFSIHHSVFDGTSTSIFLHDLCLAYDNNCSLPTDKNALEYIDYSVHERLIDMTLSRKFWYSQLEGYNMEQSLSLPFDRHRSSTDQRSNLASVVQISFDKKISTSFFDYTSSHQLTPFQLGLATFYTFLFKLTHGQTDLCITSINANRYRNELQNLIGMFVSTLPYRLQLDSYWSFDELVRNVREKCLSILEHSHYPLQHIVTDFHLNQSNILFLETMFDFITVSLKVNHLSLNTTSLEEVSMNQLYEVVKFDFSMKFVYNPTSDDDVLSCYFICSRDLFEETTVAQFARRFQHLFDQVFATNSSGMQLEQSVIWLNNVSLILPEEAEEMQTVTFRRLENITGEGM